MKKLVFAIAAAVLMASPAFAAVQNVKVSGNITSTYLNRSDFNLEKQLANGDSSRQSVFLTQTTLRVDADLSDNVSTTLGLINERAWGSDVGTGTDAGVSVYLAYVTLREFLYSPLTLSVGRQAFAFGNSFVFDATGTNNSSTGNLGSIAGDLTMRSALDAVRATLDYKPLTIDVFAAKANQGVVSNLGTKQDDVDVWGINANYQLGNDMNTIFEAYVFGKNTGKSNTSVVDSKMDKIYTPGLRVSTSPIKELNVSLEGALQRGTDTTSVSGETLVRNAFGFQALASLAIPVAELEKYKTSVSGSYTYVSGDKTSTTNNNRKTSAWDPMFENQNGGTIFNTLFNLSNMQILNVTVTASPLADVTTSLAWNGLLTAVKKGGVTTLVQPTGTSIAVNGTNVSQDNYLGNEYDANIAYQYTEDVKFGLNLGWFAPGKAFSIDNNSSAKQAIASVGVNF